MNQAIIYTKSFSAPEVDRKEVMRYAGIRESSPEAEELLDRAVALSADLLKYDVCYGIYEISEIDRGLDIGFTKTYSSSLAKTLSGCERALVFCSTVGSGIDRLIAGYSISSPSVALMLQALGSERVEALCDAFCSFISESEREGGYSCTRRFSPGYGDTPLEMQRDIFGALDCTKRIGVTLGDNLFMTPMKSVTAIIGIKK